MARAPIEYGYPAPAPTTKATPGTSGGGRWGGPTHSNATVPPTHQFIPIPGHDKPPAKAPKQAVRPAPKAAATKPAPKPVTVRAPKPVTVKPAPKASAPKPVSAAPVTRTSSPAPNANVSGGTGGFDLGSLLPLLLIAGALLAGFYLYTHRKG